MADLILRLDETEAKRLLKSATTVRPAPEYNEAEDVEAHESAVVKLRAALDSPPVEERVEYRAVGYRVGGRGGGRDVRLTKQREVSKEAAIEAVRGYSEAGVYTNVRSQSRTIGPWTDLPGEGEGDDG